MRTRNLMTMASQRRQAIITTVCSVIQYVLALVTYLRGSGSWTVGWCCGLAFGSMLNAINWWIVWYTERRFGEGSRREDAMPDRAGRWKARTTNVYRSN